MRISGCAGELAAELHELRITALAEDVRLVTYVSEVDGETANRASLWVRSRATWRIVFHQGTPTETAEPLALHRDLGDGVALRQLEPGDADELHAVIEANRGHLRPWMPWADQEAAATAGFVALATAEARRRTALHLAITLDGAIVGTCGMYSVVWRHGRAELGYWIDQGAQGHGVVTRSVAALLDHVFGDLGLRRIELRPAPHNGRMAPQIRITERARTSGRLALRVAPARPSPSSPPPPLGGAMRGGR